MTTRKSPHDKLVEKMANRSLDGVLVMDEIRFQGHIAKLETLIREESEDMNQKYKPGAWSIFLRGNQIIFRNGKHIWKTKGHARIALADKVKYRFGKEDQRNELYDQVLAYMEANKIIEFRDLSQSDQT